MTSIHDRPDHLLDLDEWDALPEDNSRRVELVEGVLVVSPRPRARHQFVIQQVATVLDGALRPTCRTLIEIELTIDGGRFPTVRAPDVTVVRGDVVDDRPRQDPRDVLAVIEVLSPGTRRTDHVAKLAEYAEVGIAHYLVVDPGPPVTTTHFRLDGGAYRRTVDGVERAVVELGGVEVVLAPE